MRSSERPATQTWRPVSFATRPMVCSRAALEAKVVTSTRPLRLLDTWSSRPSWTAASDPDGCVLEDVGRIADQREHALVADLRQRLVARRLAEHRAFRRSSSRRCGRFGRSGVSISSAVALGNRVGERRHSVSLNGPSSNDRRRARRC